jgi:hypothetical protein
VRHEHQPSFQSTRRLTPTTQKSLSNIEIAALLRLPKAHPTLCISPSQEVPSLVIRTTWNPSNTTAWMNAGYFVKSHQVLQHQHCYRGKSLRQGILQNLPLGLRVWISICKVKIALSDVFLVSPEQEQKCLCLIRRWLEYSRPCKFTQPILFMCTALLRLGIRSLSDVFVFCFREEFLTTILGFHINNCFLTTNFG